MESPSEATGEPLSFTVKLPVGFNPETTAHYVSELKNFLTSPLVESLVSAHPNEVAIKGELACINETSGHWWEWVGQLDPGSRTTLIDSLIRSATDRAIPEDVELHPSLRQLVNRIAQLRLPRAPENICGTPSPNGNTGMSPKKAHEVERLGSLIDTIYRTSIQSPTRLIVDVGAGQGYLSRRLAELAGTHVLALDGDEGQTEGAALRGKGLSHAERQRARNHEGSLVDDEDSAPSAPPVTHRTLFITSDSLLHAVDEWIGDLSLDPGTSPCPVLITGLHACGSLTPAVLRCFVDLCTRGSKETDERRWTPVALALVGCCYNLMRSVDGFPLSETATQAYPQVDLRLTQNHLQLAAQCPAQWSRSEREMERASLARRKIVWRAILARSIHNSSYESSPSEEPPKRLGRLSDRAYTSWENFVQTACEKMGLPSGITDELLIGFSMDEGQPTLPLEAGALSFQLEVLHILRALIGPVIESLIIVDRTLYLAERLRSSDGPPYFTVRASNVFDQLSSGSARNIALIVEPINEPMVHV